MNKTIDGGYNWQHFTLPDIYLSDIYFNTTQMGWYLSSNKLFRTTNSGTNWTQVLYDPDLFQNKFNWLSKAKGFITGLKTYYTADSGYTWTDLTNDVGAYVKRMHSGNEYSGFAVGDLGLIINYIDTTIVPVELISFEGIVKGKNIVLEWTTGTEINNQGFEVQRSGDKNNWQKIGFVPGNGTSTKEHHYSFTDESLQSGKYQYRLKQIDFDGSFKYSKIVEVVIGLPTKYSLSQNYPNPFNPTTKIKYEIPGQARNDNTLVTLKIFDVLGNEVATLVSEEKQPGIYQVEFSAKGGGSNLPSGVYFCQLRAENYIKTIKMLLLK